MPHVGVNIVLALVADLREWREGGITVDDDLVEIPGTHVFKC